MDIHHPNFNLKTQFLFKIRLKNIVQKVCHIIIHHQHKPIGLISIRLA
jgi:hypothetical protein